MLRPLPTIENALSRLAMLDKQPSLTKNTVIAPSDLFTPRNPRLGTSGHVGLTPAVPLKNTSASGDTKKRAPRKKTTSDDEDGAELLEADDDDEKSRGESNYSGSSDSSDDAMLYPAPPVLTKKKKKKPADEPSMSGYEARMRRLLNKDKDDVLPPGLTTWDAPCTEAHVHEYQQTMAWVRAAATTGVGTAQSTVRQLSVHAVPDGNISDNYIKSARAYYGLREFADSGVFDRVLTGAYKLKKKD